MAPPADPEDHAGETLLPGAQKAGDAKSSNSSSNFLRCCGGVCCLILLLLLGAVYGVYTYLVNDLSTKAIDQFLVLHEAQVQQFCGEDVNMHNMASKAWWPGCKFDFTKGSDCGQPCYTAAWLEEIMDYNKKQEGGWKVSYQNRPGKGEMDKDIEQVTLRGWLLPGAPEPSKHKGTHVLPAKTAEHKGLLRTGKVRPRIVIQHGFTSNSNKFHQEVMAIMLRSLGYDVLVNNFRDHCYSDDSVTHITEWGHAYPYDILGAVDYMRNDPDGHLGGKVHASQVGVVGISMGAFNAVNAFSMDPEVPAAWVDAPPSTPQSVFSNSARKEMEKREVGWLHELLAADIWKNVEDYALARGVDLNEHLPATTLPNGNDNKRPFALIGNVRDTTVPLQEVLDIAKIARALPAKYDVTMWQLDGTCKDNNHCVDHLSHYVEYQGKLATFWCGVFGGDCKPLDVENPAMKLVKD